MLLNEVPWKEPMADGGIQLVEVRAGNSPRTLMELKPGASVSPTSVGRTGMWNIDAPGILDVHAYLYFDGQALFVQSADPSNPAKGNGKAIATNWQQMEIPCTIELGKARLVYRTLETLDDDDNDKTMARPMGVSMPTGPGGGVPAPPTPQFRPGGGAFANRADDESTRFQPMNNGPAVAPPPPRGLGEPEPTIVAPLGMDDTQQAGNYAKPLPAAGQPAQPWYPSGPPSGSATTVQPMPAPPQQQYQGYGSVQVANNMPPQQPMMQMGMQQQPNMGMQQQPMQPGVNMGAMQPGLNMGAMQQPMQPMGAMQQPGQQGATQTVQTQQPSTLLDRMKKDWQATPPIKRVMLMMMPLVFIVVVMFMHHQDELQAQAEQDEIDRQEEAAASASAKAHQHDTPPDPTPSITATYTAPIASYVTPPTGLTAMPSATVTGLMPTTMPTPTVVVQPPPSATPSASASAKKPPVPTNIKSTERLAIDAVAGSDFKTAAGLYDQLALAVPPPDPRHETYAEAARIMHQKAAGTSP
jgi:hypothetical protein